VKIWLLDKLCTCLNDLTVGILKRDTFKGGLLMDRKKLMMTTVALGAAYLLRNQKSRQKLKNQFLTFAEKSKK
jgi:hypothetical protein